MNKKYNYLFYSIFLSVIFQLTCAEDFQIKQNWEFQNPPPCPIERSESNLDKYITAEFRFNICRSIFPQSISDLGCYVDRQLDNPCWINCYQDYSGKNDQTSCTKRELEDDKRLRLIGKQCGKRYSCNEYGCCDIMRKSTTPTTLPTTTTTLPTTTTTLPTTTTTLPTTTTTLPTTTTTLPTTTTTLPTTTTTLLTTTTTEQTLPSTPSTLPTSIMTLPTAQSHYCPNAGNFSSSEGPSKYWNCFFSIEVFECNENEIFDEYKRVCEFNWKPYIQCEKEGFFQNPYNCHEFYWCYRNTPESKELLIAFYKCEKDEQGQTMVWDTEHDTCVRQKDAKTCINLSLPVNDFNEWSQLETDDKYRELYENNIQCLSEGLFRNPFNCHKFYKCWYEISDDVLLDIEFYMCKDSYYFVFDEIKGRCVHQDQTSQCINKVPSAYFQITEQSSFN